jgi:thioesterase domain-containing protein
MMAQGNESAAIISRESLGLPADFRAPAAGLETQIASAFGKVFGVDRVGMDDDFYDLGGDSLIGEALSMEILERTGHTFQMSWLFEHGSPAKVASKLGTNREALEFARPPIFLIHGLAGVAQPRPSFYEGLAPDQKLVLFELPGLRGRGGTEYESIHDIAAAYLRELVATYPTGPILLGSFCTGALIALEMAAQLQEAGRPLHHLVLLDPGMPPTVTDRHRYEAEAAGKKVVRLKREEGPEGDRKSFIVQTTNLLATGRFKKMLTPEDFANERIRQMTVRYYFTLLKFLALRRRWRKSGKAAWDMNHHARAKLYAAYRHYWPGTYEGSVDVVASAERRVLMEDPTQIWERVLPNRKVRITGERHKDVIGATGGQTSALMQKLFDDSLRRIAAPAREAELA